MWLKLHVLVIELFLLLVDVESWKIREFPEYEFEPRKEVLCVLDERPCQRESPGRAYARSSLIGLYFLTTRSIIQELYKSITITLYTMKTFTLLSLVGAAAAFAPASRQVRKTWSLLMKMEPSVTKGTIDGTKTLGFRCRRPRSRILLFSHYKCTFLFDCWKPYCLITMKYISRHPAPPSARLTWTPWLEAQNPSKTSTPSTLPTLEVTRPLLGSVPPNSSTAVLPCLPSLDTGSKPLDSTSLVCSARMFPSNLFPQWSPSIPGMPFLMPERPKFWEWSSLVNSPVNPRAPTTWREETPLKLSSLSSISLMLMPILWRWSKTVNWTTDVLLWLESWDSSLPTTSLDLFPPLLDLMHSNKHSLVQTLCNIIYMQSSLLDFACWTGATERP